MNRTLVEKARTMLIDANLSPYLCAQAVGTANYLRNRCRTKALRKMTPEEAWSGRKPNLAHLKVFGCLAMIHVPSGQQKKWDPKSEERIFVGYCETSKGYRTVDHGGSTEIDPNPSDPPKVDTDSNEPIVQSPQPSAMTSPEELRRPLRNHIPNRNIFNSDFLSFQAQVREQSNPISYEEAVNRPDANNWLKAINEELASHRESQSWEPAV
ncbi:Retrovirus-related Pol polyprotein from transposon TNT 1-94 [Trichinella nelsoni]|uniref:Retrovirus-related Pol polyprotein from transposon TNT 1-94 n=1 Tax=Trichinella nelsoni TaxID=6336 RepID=A0A0V0S7J2_9BILA|nr:Retrovirus-related Pol polyprotein from transposon TNT 1-94 [Trichinella nelsoni]